MRRKGKKRIRLSFIGGRRPSILPPKVKDDSINKQSSDENINTAKESTDSEDEPLATFVSSIIKHGPPTPKIAKQLEDFHLKSPIERVNVMASSLVMQTNNQEDIKEDSKNVKRKRKILKPKPEHLHLDVLRKEVEESLEIEKACNAKLMKEHKAALLAIKSEHVTWKGEFLSSLKDLNQIDNIEVPILSVDVQKSLDEINDICEKISVAEIQSKLLKKTHLLMKEKAKKQLCEHQKEINTTIYKDMDNTTMCATPRQLIRQILRPMEN